MFILSPRLRYQVVQDIDYGAQGSVQKVLDRSTGEMHALKTYLHLDRPAVLTAFEAEVDALTALATVPGVLKLIDSWRTFDKGYLVTELCQQSLDTAVYGKLSGSQVREVGRFLFRTLSSLHQQGLQHCDVKPSNILRLATTEPDPEDTSDYRLCDFGLSMNTKKHPLVCDFRGTIDYIAPECVRTPEEYQQPILGKSDVWSMGVTLYELYTGESPFYEESTQDTLQNILHREPNMRAIRDVVLADLLRRVLKKDPRERPTLQQLVSHPYLVL